MEKHDEEVRKMTKRIYPVDCGECQQCKDRILAHSAGFVKPNRKFCSKRCRMIYHNKKDSNPSKRIEQRKATGERSRKLYTGRPKPNGFGDQVAKAISGENHWNWQGGKTKEVTRARNSREYKRWRTAVFERDNYTCTWCGARSKKDGAVILNADHILPFSKFPDQRYELSNGRTLCLDCHKKTPTFGWKCIK